MALLHTLRLLFAVLLAGMILAGPAAHIHNHPAMAAHGGSGRTEAQCSFCAAGGGHAVVTANAAVPSLLALCEELRPSGIIVDADSAGSTAISRAPPTA